MLNKVIQLSQKGVDVLDFLNDTLSAVLTGRKKKREKKPQVEEVIEVKEEVVKEVVEQPQVEEVAIINIVSKSATPTQQIEIPVAPKEPKKSEIIALRCKGELKRKFQNACAEDGRKMSSLVELWINRYLTLREEYEV